MKHSGPIIVASVLVLAGLGMCLAAEEVPKDPAALKEPDTDVSKITLKVKDAALGEVLKALAEQSGNLPVRPPLNWQEKRLTLDLKGVPYWQALDAVCAEAGLSYETTSDSHSLRLVPKGDSENVTVHSGPVALTLNIDEMKKIREAQPIRRVTRRQCGFYCVWEDRLPMLETEVVFSSVVTPDGTTLEVAPLPEYIRQLVQTDGVAPRSLAYIHVLDAPKDMTRVREIKGIVRASFGIGKNVTTIEDAISGDARSTTVGPSTLTAKMLAQRQGVLMLILSEKLDGKRVNPMTCPASQVYGTFLVDPKGGRHLGAARWRGNVKLVGQFMGPDGKMEGGIPVREVGQTIVEFADLPGIPGEWKLEHVVPQEIIVREYPFTFKDVPLPPGIRREPPRPAPKAQPVEKQVE